MEFKQLVSLVQESLDDTLDYLEATNIRHGNDDMWSYYVLFFNAANRRHYCPIIRGDVLQELLKRESNQAYELHRVDKDTLEDAIYAVRDTNKEKILTFWDEHHARIKSKSSTSPNDDTSQKVTGKNKGVSYQYKEEKS